MADDHKPGPDTSYTPEIGARICELLAEGKSMHEICRMEGSPSRRSICNWLNRFPEFRAMHDEARKVQEYFHADRILEMADGTSEANANSMRVKIGTYQWWLARTQPKRFGDKVQQEISGKDGKPIQAAISVTFVRPENDAG